MIAVIGAKAHYQVAAVCGALSALGRAFTLIDREASESFRLTIPPQEGEPSLHVAGRDLSEVGVFWFADKFSHARFGSSQEWASQFVSGSNWYAAQYNLLSVVGGCVLNPPDAVYLCQSKLKQLLVARRAGFRVPETLLTNDIGVLREQIRQNGPRIVKMLGDPHIPTLGDEVGQRAILTNDLPETLLSAHDRPHEDYPLYTQEKLNKAYELRVVVVDDEAFAFKIDPEQHPVMRTDYRRGGALVEYALWPMPTEFAGAMAALHKSFGLFSGSYDFVVTKEGEFVFLEVNPEGMWAPQDEAVAGAISRCFARKLAERDDFLRADKRDLARDRRARRSPAKQDEEAARLPPPPAFS